MIKPLSKILIILSIISSTITANFYTPINSTLDTRLLTKEGRKDIKDDYNKATAITKAINLIVSTNNAEISKFFDYVGEFYSGYNKDKILLTENLNILDDPNSNVFEKQQAAQNIVAQAGLNIKFANLENYSGGKFNQDDPNTIYINTKSLQNVDTFLTALRHEQVHYNDNKNNKFIPKDKNQNEFATNLSLAKLDMSIKALNINNKKPNEYNLNIDKTSSTIINNTNYLYSLDNSKSDDWVMQMVGGAIGAGSNLYTQYERNSKNLSFNNINWSELGLNIAMGAYSGGATSLSGSIIRGGVASMTTEAYNQVEYSKGGVDYIEIAKKGFVGSVIGYGINKFGSIGNNIIKANGVIGKPIDYPLKTFEYEFSGVAGFGTASIKSYLENKKDKDSKK